MSAVTNDTYFAQSPYLDRENGIGGTVNFDPTISEASDDTSVLVRYKNIKTADGERCDTEDIRYPAAVPLTSDSDEYDLAGKLKMKIPFDIIEGVKLSLLECDITTDIYYVDADSKGSGTFVSYTGTTDLQTSIAEGVKTYTENGELTTRIIPLFSIFQRLISASFSTR